MEKRIAKGRHNGSDSHYLAKKFIEVHREAVVFGSERVLSDEFFGLSVRHLRKHTWNGIGLFAVEVAVHEHKQLENVEILSA